MFLIDQNVLQLVIFLMNGKLEGSKNFLNKRDRF